LSILLGAGSFQCEFSVEELHTWALFDRMIFARNAIY
jgi:hypothetical protein